VGIAGTRVRLAGHRVGRCVTLPGASECAGDSLRKRGVEISERTVGHLLNRYDEVLAVSLTDSRRLREQQGRVILAVDGLQPDVGHEVLRECVSGEIMLARSMLSAATEDFAGGGAGWATGGGNGGGGDQ
jgi:hypothetical protein